MGVASTIDPLIVRDASSPRARHSPPEGDQGVEPRRMSTRARPKTPSIHPGPGLAVEYMLHLEAACATRALGAAIPLVLRATLLPASPGILTALVFAAWMDGTPLTGPTLKPSPGLVVTRELVAAEAEPVPAVLEATGKESL